MTKVVIVDYGSGNISSVANAISREGFEVAVDVNGSLIGSADRLVVPGVAAFGASKLSLVQRNQFGGIMKFHQLGGPILGLCLGAQLFSNSSEESLGIQGFGFLPAEVKKIQGDKCRVPNQGWSSVKFDSGPLEQSELNEKYFYFCHSYKIVASEKLDEEAYADINGERILAYYRQGNVTGIQFHPEKSALQGLRLLRLILSNQN